MSTQVITGDRVTSRTSRAKAVRAKAVAQQQTDLIRKLIWLYMVLWLIEGGLRRWFLPGLATPLLLVRDPLVVYIYYLSISNNIFPSNGFIVWGSLLGVLSFANAVLLGHGNFFVAFYGVRCDFLHVPLIFVMAKVLRGQDLLKLGKVALWIAGPYTALLVAQFYEPQDAWVNRGLGGDMEGAGFAGALDRFRPPGTFSFISGPSQLYPLFTSFWFMMLLARRLPVWLMAVSGGAILVCIPISISRMLFLSVAIVAVVGLVALFLGGRFSMKLLIQVVVAAVVMTAFASQSTIFKDGMAAFSARWDDATTGEGGFKEAIVDRALNDLFGGFQGVGLSGLGTGFSTNVGQKMITEKLGFGASEAEWGRLLYDNGFVLGSFMIIYRICLAGSLVVAALKAWQRKSPYAMIFVAACWMMVLNGPWGQATTMGSAIIGAGLVMAAAKPEKPAKQPIGAKAIALKSAK